MYLPFKLLIKIAHYPLSRNGKSYKCSLIFEILYNVQLIVQFLTSCLRDLRTFYLRYGSDLHSFYTETRLADNKSFCSNLSLYQYNNINH